MSSVSRIAVSRLARVSHCRAVEALDVTIVTSKVDKYDRYLADVHLTLRSGEEVFLNNHLLQHGHAVRTDGATAETWVP
jgi:endonuclease YncB( thermonuclease family)